MVRIHTTALMRVALLPVALLMAIGGSVMAFASGAGPVAGATSGAGPVAGATSGAGPVAGATSGAPAAASQSYYTMQLSSPSATVRAGRVTRTAVSFRAPDDLYGTPVNLSVSGLPRGVRASFSPRVTTIGGSSILTFTTAPSSPAGAFAVTVTAITESSDPIGTSATFGLTILAR